jgi:hypothetical protein
MAKTITKVFQYNLPDDYLSNESTLGLKAEWTYTGPEKIWVFVDYKTNKLLARESYREYNESDPEKQYEELEEYTGLNSYPVLVTFYARPDPTVPDHTIEVQDCEYDPKLKKWKKPYPWKIPHITRPEFEFNHKIILEDALAIRERYDENEWTEDQREKWDAFIAEMENVPVKFAAWLDRPWMVPFPNDPRLDPEWKDFVDADPESGNLPAPDPQPKIISEGVLVQDPAGARIVISSPTEKVVSEETGETLVAVGTTAVFNITPSENETDEEAGRMPGMPDWTKVSPPEAPAAE